MCLFSQISLFALNISKAEFSVMPLLPHPASSVLNETLAIDIACQTNAEVAGLRGTFVAFVTRPGRSLKQLLELQRGDHLPVINTKVLYVVDNCVSLNGYHGYKIISISGGGLD